MGDEAKLRAGYYGRQPWTTSAAGLRSAVVRAAIRTKDGTMPIIITLQLALPTGFEPVFKP